MRAGLAAFFSSDRGVTLVLVAAALVVHARVVGATFVGDDFRHLFESEALPFGKFLLRTNAGHFMAVHNVLFVLLHNAVSVYPVPYYALELGTHLLNVALFFVLLRRIGCTLELSTVVAFLWGIAPVHQGTLRWFSVYQAVLTTTTTLVALLQLGNAIEQRRRMTKSEILVATAALWIGAATVGGGTVVALFFPVIAWLTLPTVGAPARTAAIFTPVALVGFLAPRLLAENVALDPRTVPALLAELVAYGAGALLAGPALTVTEHGVGLLGKLALEVPITVGAILALPLLVIVVVRFARSDRRERFFIIGMFLLAGSQYGAVAVTRSWFANWHSVAWIATRDRYHYAQGLFLALGIAAALRHLSLSPAARKRFWSFALPIGTALTLLSMATAMDGDAHDEVGARDFTASLSRAIRNAARQLTNGSDLYISNADFNPVSIDVAMGMPRWQFPGIGGYWTIDHGTAPFEGRRIRFVEPNISAVADIRANVLPEVAALFVTPDEAREAGANALDLPELQAMRQHWWEVQDQEIRAAATRSFQRSATTTDQLREAIQRDPKAMEEFRRALERDPKAKEALQREMERQAHPEGK